ncbi:folylpolyglutamate synthase mitochondrial-like isoform X1 [Biomphalaria glabrata]|nr:folylpolyglutamate synthase; mitochondrial-like isoform X1 [Biomphalaria glabrata]
MELDIEANYNKAVETLNTKLMSLRGWHEQTNRLKYEGKTHLIIPMVNRFIHRSGLTDKEVDKLCMIHITGTKGKGSTSAFTENILRNHGYRTGLFTSPHLVEVRERIRINGRPLCKAKYCYYFWKVYNKLKETEEVGSPIEEGRSMPAYFAFNVVLSLHIFLNEGVDIAIMEVGVGGLTDSTNFIRHPVACAITSLGLEHTDDLGDTIESIAFHKSGIFKKHCPALTAPQSDSAMQVILNRAKEMECPLYVMNPLSEEVMKEYNFTLSIAGDKQRHNAALAIQLFHLWEDYQHKKVHPRVSNDLNVGEIPRLTCTKLDSATVVGLSTCKWPGRAQVIAKDSITYYIDGAHTKESMELCTSWFSEVADKEKASIDGKVVRVLIFFTAPERDPEALVYPLRDCEFDAAVFCPFVVSTIESQCRPDLQLKKLDPKVQSETVERNKLAWDKLMANTQREKNNLKLLKAGWPVEDLLKSNVQDKRLNSSDGDSSEKSSVISASTTESDRSDLMSIGSSEDAEGGEGIAPNRDLLPMGDMLSYVIEPSLILNANLLCHSDKQDKNEKLNSELTSSLNSNPSLIFPCIIEALRWAGQGRDSTVQVLDGCAVPHPVPASLQGATHIQILATGSLNFVGGVLDVLTSIDGDVYL